MRLFPSIFTGLWLLLLAVPAKGGTTIPCPDCETPIPINTEGLLRGDTFHCPNCGLTLTLNRNSEEPAKGVLNQLQELKKAAAVSSKTHGRAKGSSHLTNKVKVEKKSAPIEIPADSQGKVIVLLESSSDGENWKPAKPRTYGTNKKIYYRVRTVSISEPK